LPSYDLLGASQEHSIKPKKFAQTDIDEVIIGHTNEPEYRKLQITNTWNSSRPYSENRYSIHHSSGRRNQNFWKDYNPEKIRGKHIAPHTLEMVAMWAVLTQGKIQTRSANVDAENETV
jgi:serine protein kinase